jgi:two-component system, NtrC family, nitrogen regulation sensor histidine kinase NtrY
MHSILTNFRLNIALRILLIIGLGCGAVYVATQTYFWLVSVWIALLALVLLIELIRYVERSDKDLLNFLLAIRQSDFASVYPVANTRNSQVRLRLAYQEILEVFKRLRSEKEFGHHYLQTVVEHVNVALICYDSSETIVLMNEAARQLTGKPFLRTVESIERLHPLLLRAVRKLRPGGRELVKVEINGRPLHLSVQSAVLRLQAQTYTLLSLQDIRHELEAQEVEAWQKLIRVLTHEIMNSVIPIATLSSVVNEMLTYDKGRESALDSLSEEDTADIRYSLQTIENRSKGLISFVKAYSSLTKTVEPVLAEVSVDSLFSRLHTLLNPGIAAKKIHLSYTVLPPQLRIRADAELLEQVLINLIMNAADAVAESTSAPRIELTARLATDGQAIIQVSDNGSGMTEEVRQQIFIPFYTTKKKGSGIGLSLSKQIMHAHKGTISVQSRPGEGSIFTLSFPPPATPEGMPV